MNAKNDIDFFRGNDMAHKEICPLCSHPALATGKHNASGCEGEAKVSTIYFTCTNVPRCGVGFKLIQSFGGYTNKHLIQNRVDFDLLERIQSLDSAQKERLLAELS